MKRDVDLLSIVEAAYDLELGTRDWLSRLLERAAPHLDRGLGMGATMWRLGQGADESTVVTHRMGSRVLDALISGGRANPGRAHQKATSGLILGTDSQRLGLREHEALPQDALETCETYLYPLGVRDVLNLSFPDPSGPLVLIATPMPDTRRPSRRDTATWSRIAVHIAAGARLRAVTTEGRGNLADGADAILSPSGVVHHALPEAQGPGARAALHRAALAVDRARSSERSDEDRALNLWQGLVAGRWSLVDRFDTDGRRYLVARRNDPDVCGLRALTRRERQVLAYAATGHPLKIIGYSLGISVPTVALHRTRAMRKLGLRTQADLLQLFAQGPSR